MILPVVTVLLAFCESTFAHGGVQLYTIDGKTYQGYKWADPAEGQKDLIQRTWNANPLSDPASNNLTCNFKGTTVPGTFHAPVQAGDTIRTTWVEDGFGWPHTLGPLVAYMASCGDDCTTISNPETLKWFKIAEEGLREGHAIGDKEGWFQNDLWESQKTDHWDVVVPKNLKPGRYMIRHEIIMIELSPVQFYPNCAHLEISGSGLSVPSEEFLVQFPGAYSLSDPGIVVSGHVRGDTSTKNYTVPGPRVWAS